MDFVLGIFFSSKKISLAGEKVGGRLCLMLTKATKARFIKVDITQSVEWLFVV